MLLGIIVNRAGRNRCELVWWRMKVLILHYGMGMAGQRVIDDTMRQPKEDGANRVRLRPREEHGRFGRLLRSFIPGWRVDVRPVDLHGYNLIYLPAPKV